MPAPKRPRDPTQLAKRIVDIATGDIEEKKEDEIHRARVLAAKRAAPLLKLLETTEIKPSKRGHF